MKVRSVLLLGVVVAAVRRWPATQAFLLQLGSEVKSWAEEVQKALRQPQVAAVPTATTVSMLPEEAWSPGNYAVGELAVGPTREPDVEGW